MKYFSLAAAVALALALAGCGSDDSSAGSGPTESTASDQTESTASDAGSDGGEHAHDESGAVADGARRIEVTAKSFEFDPTEIRVEAGEDIAIVLTSADILHDFIIDDLGAHVAADPGKTAEGGFTADAPGTYTYYCSVPGHRSAGMEGTLIVE